MDVTRVLEALDAARAETWQRAEREFKEVTTRRDSDLAKLDIARDAFTEMDPPSNDEPASNDAPAETRPGPKPKRRMRRKGLSPASPKKLAERREKVARFIEESANPVQLKEIIRALGLTEHKAHAAITDLEREGRVKRVGVGASIRYMAADRQLSPLSRQAPTQGTLEERIVAVLEDRHQATVEELAQALRMPLGEVGKACGRLQGEERIHMRRINGRPVYVLAVRI
jgi:hypothetical protein